MTDKHIFVLMPFKEEFDDVYMAIRDSVSAASKDLNVNLVCRRADEIDSPGRITDQMIEHIREADLIIVDLTASNPNVMYELGYAHALGKPTIILNQNVHQAPFDVKDFRQILYDRNRLVKDCRPRIITAISDVFGDETARDEEPGAQPSAVLPGAQQNRESQFSNPLKPSATLVAMLQSLHLKLQLANSRSDTAAVRGLGQQVREILDRVTIISSGDKADINNTAAVIGNCAVELEKGEQQDEAENIYRRAIGLFPDYAGLHLQYADCLVDAGRMPEALAELERAKTLSPTDGRISNIELKMSMLKGEADVDLLNSLRTDFYDNPGNMRAATAYLVYLDRIKAPLAEFEQVCRDWEAALSEDEKHLAVRSLADKYATEGSPEWETKAIEIYNSLLATNTGVDRRAILHNVATLYANQGKRELAKSSWLEAYQLNPADPTVRAAFSQRLASWKEFELAIKVAEGAPIA